MIVTIVLVDGSQIIGKQLSSNKAGTLLENVMKIIPVLDDRKQWQLMFQNFPFEGKDPIYIEEQAVITATAPSENMEKFYLEQTTTLDLTTKLK